MANPTPVIWEAEIPGQHELHRGGGQSRLILRPCFNLSTLQKMLNKCKGLNLEGQEELARMGWGWGLQCSAHRE